jgi:hypothetical protein
MTKPAGFFTYFHHSALINHLTDEQAGRLFKALLIYGDEGEIADLDDDQACTLAFIIMKGEIYRNFERYAETCEKRREAGKKGGRTRKSNQNEETKIYDGADL